MPRKTQDAPPATQPALYHPEIVHGLRHRFREQRGEDPQWRAVKDQMKAISLDRQLQQFLAGNPNPKSEIRLALEAFIDTLPAESQGVADQARKYAKRKSGQTFYSFRQDGHGLGSGTFHRGLQGPPVYRSESGLYFRKPDRLDEVHRALIEKQTGLPHHGENPALGRGSEGEVRMAEVLGPHGERERMIAAKSQNSWRAASRIKQDIRVTAQLPELDCFTRTRDHHRSRTGASVTMLLDLARGDLSRLTRDIQDSKALSMDEKKSLHWWLGKKQLIPVAALHGQAPPIVHGDLVRGNYLLSQNKGAQANLVLSDFAKSRIGGNPGRDRADLMLLFMDFTIAGHEEWDPVIDALGDNAQSLQDIVERHFAQTISDEQATHLIDRVRSAA